MLAIMMYCKGSLLALLSRWRWLILFIWGRSRAWACFFLGQCHQELLSISREMVWRAEIVCLFINVLTKEVAR